MILVDSSVWIGLFRGDSNPQTKLMLSILQSGDEELAIADIILPEVLQGFRSEKQAHTALQAIEGLPALHWAANLWLFWRPPTIASCVKKKVLRFVLP